jgi:ABC-type multidrug transport system ATPase subunit
VRRGSFRLSCPEWTTSPGLTAVVGLNGAGKSTLLRLLTGDRTGMTAGEVVVCPRTNYLPQAARLPSLQSVRDLFIYLAALRGVRRDGRAAAVDRALDTAGLRAYARSRVATLSGGWQQRALVGQCLLGRPEVLILDEPTSELDVGAAREVWMLLKALGTDLPIVVATHEASASVEFCDQMVTISEGHVAEPRDGVTLRRDLEAHAGSVESYLLALIGPGEGNT